MIIVRSVKIDCITVSTSPVKATIDDLIQRLFDALIISLRRSIVTQYNSIDSYLTKSMENLSQVPKTIEEMGEANEKYRAITAEKSEVGTLFYLLV